MIEGLTGITKSNYTGDDLISRTDAIKEIEELPNAYNGWSDTYDKACIIGVLEEVPTADVVEVVRCKDCVYSEAMNTTGLVYCNEIKTACSEEGYCYIGEQRGW